MRKSVIGLTAVATAFTLGAGRLWQRRQQQQQ